tara:strand:- start:10761 stop:11648 length:888 start_codon:yes stop_codon:yes gene_type:complete
MKKIKKNILFIGGTGRNGSTILAKILDQSNDAINIGEAARYSLSQRMQKMNIPCECGKLVEHCNFWSNKDIINKDKNLDNRLLKFKRIIRLFLLSYITNSNQYQKTKNHILSIYKKLNNNNIYIDTSKHPSFSLLYNDIDVFDIFYIHLVRSPYQFVSSQTKRKKYLPGKASVLKASMQWVFYNLFFEIFRFFNKDKCIRIFYEDFVQNPNLVIEKIEKRYKSNLNISFKKLDSHNQIVLTKIGHSLAGNPDKFSKNKITIEQREHNITIFRKILITFFCLPLIMLYINKYYKFK